MPEEEETKIEDISAEKFILEDMGVTPEQLERVNSLDAANKLIKYMQSKATKPEEQNPKGMLTLKKNMGKPLPDPEKLTDPIKLNLQEAMNPLSVKRANNCRWNKKARLMMRFNEDTGQMEVF